MQACCSAPGCSCCTLLMQLWLQLFEGDANDAHLSVRQQIARKFHSDPATGQVLDTN